MITGFKIAFNVSIIVYTSSFFQTRIASLMLTDIHGQYLIVMWSESKPECKSRRAAHPRGLRYLLGFVPRTTGYSFTSLKIIRCQVHLLSKRDDYYSRLVLATAIYRSYSTTSADLLVILLHHYRLNKRLLKKNSQLIFYDNERGPNEGSLHYLQQCK